LGNVLSSTKRARPYCFGQQPQDWIARPGAWEATAATEGTNETAIREPAGRLDTGRTSSRIGSPAPRGRVWKRGSASESWIVNGAWRYGKTWPEKLRASTAFSPCFAYLNFPPHRAGEETGLRPKDDGVGAGSGRHLALRKMISPSIEKKSSLQDLYPPIAGEERNILWCCNLPAASVTINGICGPAASARGQGGR
jgi:hypothetical protein